MSIHDEEFAPHAAELVVAIAEENAIEPPFTLRSRILREAQSRRPSVSTSQAPANGSDSYRRIVGLLDSLLAGLTQDQWNVTVINGWTVEATVSHLRVVDEIATSTLRGGHSNTSSSDIVDYTVQAVSGTASPAEVHDGWRHQTRELLDAFDRCTKSTIDYLGFALAPDAVIVDRAFETWLHTQDIRVALGCEFEPPIPSDLATLTDLGARMLGKVVHNTGVGTVRLMLNGMGSWLIPLASDDFQQQPHTTVALDPIDFCLLIADRLAVTNLQMTIEGDEATAIAVLSRAPELARL